MIRFDFETYMEKEITKENIIAYSNTVNRASNEFIRENKMADWYDYENCISEEEIKDVLNTAEYVRANCETFIVIGIGGSYLGAKGVIDALRPYFNKPQPEIIFAGNNLSSDYLTNLIDYINDKEVMLNVISKSGDTLEPSITFNILYKALKNKYNDEQIRRRIIITTDKENGSLLEISKRLGCKRYAFPSNIGGRFSTLTVAGLLPIAVAGIDINSMLDGAQEAKNNSRSYHTYTSIRDIMYNKGKVVETFNVYEPKLASFLEWVKQIFAETQGKNKKGILPISTINTRDLHSLGQYFQDGKDIIFETSIDIEKSKELYIDRYNKYLDSINSIALKSVAKAHEEGHSLTSIITMDELNAYNLGYLIAFFEISSMLGAYVMGVPYYNQPGVENYKQIMNEKLNIK